MELALFVGLTLLIVYVSYTLGYASHNKKMKELLPLYQLHTTQLTILNLAAGGYLNVIEEDGKLLVLPIDQPQEVNNVSQKSSESKEKA